MSNDCAFCVYSLGNEDGCNIKFSVTYKNDSSALKYQIWNKTDSFQQVGGGINSCNYTYKFVKNDFIINGKLSCPNLKLNFSSSSSGTKNWNFKYQYTVDQNGKFTATNESVIVKGTNENNQNNTTQGKAVSYQYDICKGIIIRIVDGKAVIEKDYSSDDYIVNGDVDASLFTDKTVPPIYYQEFNSHGYQGCAISTTKISGYIKANGHLIDENTGEITQHEFSDSNPNPTLPDLEKCNDLLGDPGTDGSPAFYISKAFHVIKYVAIVLLIVLSVMDFTGAIVKEDKDAMAKILKRMIMRFILCIIIFLLPYLIDLLLKYLVERSTDLCGIN